MAILCSLRIESSKSQRIAMRVQLVLVLLRDQQEHDKEEENRVASHFQPCKGRRVDRLQTKPLTIKFATIHAAALKQTTVINHGRPIRAVTRFTARWGIVALPR